MSDPAVDGRDGWRTQFARYVLVGIAVFFLGLGQYGLLYSVLPHTAYRATIAWLLNFLLGTLWTHAIHRYVTFRGSKRLSYLASLLRTYVGYAGIQLIGSLMMLLLVDTGGVHHLVGWCAVTLVISLLNFLVMRYFSIVSWEDSR